MYWNFSGKFLSSNANMNFNTQFKNLWRLNGQFNRQSQGVSTTLLRGGPSFIQPGNENFSLFLMTDQSKKIAAGIGNFHGRGDARSSVTHMYWTNLTIRPSNSISVSVEPEYGMEKNEMQFVTLAESAEGPVYLFARIDQKTLSATFRINYTINPELSIEYYGQPFVAAGKYNGYKKITIPDASRFRKRFHLFGPDELDAEPGTGNILIREEGSEDLLFGNPDFNFRQFRSNLVVRWEYLPGSVLYLVWSQGRTSSANNGSFSYGNDLKDLFGVTPHNVFLLKFSYWFSL
jgi:hypothetical protein